MALIEAGLIIIILILIIVLINHNSLIKLIKSKVEFQPILKIFERFSNLIKKLRRFSLVFILKQRIYHIYIIVAITIVTIKIYTHYNPQMSNIFPVWLDKSMDFLLLSSAWEIVCLLTKIIEQNIDKK